MSDEDGSNKFHLTSKRSASLAATITDDATDEEARNKLHLVSKRSVSLIPGIIDRVAVEDDGGKFSEASTSSAPHATEVITNKDDSKKFHLESKESVSLAAEAIDHVTDEEARNKFHFTSKESVSLAAEVIDHARDEEARNKFKLASNRSISLVPGIIDNVADEDVTSKFSEVSAKSALLVTGVITGAADKDDRNKLHKASKESVSSAVGVTDHGPDEDDRKDFIKTSRPSVSINTEPEPIKNATHEDQSKRIALATKRSASLAGAIDHASGKDVSIVFKQSTKRSASLGGEAAAAEDRHKVSKAEERKISVSSKASDSHTITSENNSGSASRSRVHHVSKFSKTRSSFSVHDSSYLSKGKLDVKRASFQTSVIEDLSISEAKEDDDDDGGKNIWKRMFERKVAKRVLNVQEQKSMFMQKRKHDKANLEKKIPMDLLVKEWFKENKMTVQTRIYILEKLLPTLILGLENLLNEVEKKGLTVLERPHPYFNPINFLAQFLMRNNPRYHSIPEEDSYLIDLQRVTQDLKNHATDIKDNRQDIVFQIYTLF